MYTDKFTGKERDDESGLDNFGARYLTSTYGRFMTPDWSASPEPVPYANLANPQTLNLYAMVQNDPESSVDLDGHVNTQDTAMGTCDVVSWYGCDEEETGFLYNTYEHGGYTHNQIADMVNKQGHPGQPFAFAPSAAQLQLEQTLTRFDLHYQLQVAMIKDPELRQQIGNVISGGVQIGALLSPGTDVGEGIVGAGEIGQAAGTIELDAGESWGKLETLVDHFLRHGGDFGSTSAGDYADEASEFLQRAQAERLPTKIDSDGTIRVYDPKTNTFGSYNADGTTKTFFRPKNPATYWNAQKGTLVY